MAISQVSLAALIMSATFASSITDDVTELFPTKFPATDALYEQLDATVAGPEEETEAAAAMKNLLIEMFDLKPIHVDNEQIEPERADNEKKSKKQRHGRVVQNDIGGLGWDYAHAAVNDKNVGWSEEATVQMALSWAAPLFLDTVDRYTLLSANPKFIYEILGSFALTFHLNFIEVTIKINVNPFKFTPFDLLFRTDALHPQRQCAGYNYKVRTFQTEFMIETRVNECFYGLLGNYTENDPSDCTWRTYKPELPLYIAHFEDIGDVDGTYIKYQCADWYSATWDNWPLTEEYIDIHRQ